MGSVMTGKICVLATLLYYRNNLMLLLFNAHLEYTHPSPFQKTAYHIQ